MALFPTVDETEVAEVDLPIVKEWAWDFDINDFKLKNGKPYLVEGKEAVQIWAYKALLTNRFVYPVYSWIYGSELNGLIGSDYSKAATESEVKRLVEECLMPSPYIEGTTNYKVYFDGETLNVSFTLLTVYGDVEVGVFAY